MADSAIADFTDGGAWQALDFLAGVRSPYGAGDDRKFSFFPASDSTAGGSTRIGVGALSGQTSSAAYGNTAVGYQSMAGTLTTAAVSNAAFGYRALASLTSGAVNAAFGYQALENVTTTDASSAFGYQALQSSTGGGNVAMGFRAMWASTSASNNTAIGAYAMYFNSTGGANVAIGTQAMNNSLSSNNVAIGNEAAAMQTTGNANVAVGNFALRDNTTGNYNVVVGQEAFRYGIGSNNAILGRFAGKGVSATTTASDSVFIGYEAGLAITTGNNNIFIGSGAGGTTTTGSTNIIIGKDIDAPAASTSNYVNFAGSLIVLNRGQSNEQTDLYSGGSSVLLHYGGPGYGTQALQCTAAGGFYITGTAKTLGLSSDLFLQRDAANILAIRNSTAGQTIRTYGTYTDGSNYRRVSLSMSTAGVATLLPEGAGTGASGNVIHISGLPTSNPGPGILWNNAGTPAIGT